MQHRGLQIVEILDFFGGCAVQFGNYVKRISLSDPMGERFPIYRLLVDLRSLGHVAALRNFYALAGDYVI